MPMNRSLIAVLFFSLAACSAFKIEPERVANATRDAELEVTKVNKFPQGFQCFEPMLNVLTLGLVPAHCVDTYSVLAAGTSQEVVRVEVTYVYGWVALLLPPLPSWRYGDGQGIEPEISEVIRNQE